MINIESFVDILSTFFNVLSSDLFYIVTNVLFFIRSEQCHPDNNGTICYDEKTI